MISMSNMKTKKFGEIPRMGVSNDFSFVQPQVYQQHRYLSAHIVRRPWEGRRVFIVGGGESLKGFDFSQLKGEIVIAINRAAEAVPGAAILMFLDEQFFGWAAGGKLGENMQQIFDSFAGYKLTASRVGFPYPEDIYCVKYKDARHPRLDDWIQDGLYMGNLTGTVAANLSVAMGAKQIYLLGFDGDGGKERNPNKYQTWFHGGYPEKANTTIYSRYHDDMDIMAPLYREKNIEVVNLNQNSGITCFKFGSMADIKKTRRPVICSFYTQEYKDLAKRMERSAKLFGFETDLKQVEKVNGSWLETIYTRANFVLEMLEKHGRDIVWLDSDAVIDRYPELFDEFDGDFGAHVHEWTDRGKELLGGTMYFRHTEATLELVKKWISLNGSLPKQALSQWVIPQALEGWSGKFVNLPANYTQIFDLMADAGEPIISHYQASRQFRNRT